MLHQVAKLAVSGKKTEKDNDIAIYFLERKGQIQTLLLGILCSKNKFTSNMSLKRRF